MYEDQWYCDCGPNKPFFKNVTVDPIWGVQTTYTCIEGCHRVVTLDELYANETPPPKTYEEEDKEIVKKWLEQKRQT